MSLWNFFFDSEWQQRADIDGLKSSSDFTLKRLTVQRRETKARIAALEQQVGELALVCRSLLTLLRESGAIDPSRLEEVMRRIDAEDGVIDGRVTPESERPRRPDPRK